MGRLLVFLWSGCWHKWRIHQEGSTVDGQLVIGKWYDLQCEICGDMKRRNHSS